MNRFISEQGFTEQTLQALFWFGDQIPGGFFIYQDDALQEIIYINRALLSIFGCDTLEEFKTLTGNTFRGLVHPDDFDFIQSSIDKQIEADANGKLDYVEYRIIRKDGEIRWVDDYGHHTTMPGYGKVYFVFITDVTEKHRMQVDKMRIELEFAREKQHNEVKSGFLFNMSHDIRTPMNAIVGFSALARRHINEPELLTGYLDKTITSGQLMLTLLDDMLEMNKLEGGLVHLNLEPTDLREQISAVTDMFRLESEKKLVVLKEDIELPDEKVLVDQNRFCRIIGNLISNAIKFTPSGGIVCLTAKQKQPETDGTALYEFQVSDNGIGISEEFLDKVFDSFERENTSTQTGAAGTGLGLSIVKSLLILMDGTITAESKKGKGSVFTVTLPLKVVKDTEAAGNDNTEVTPEAAPDTGKHRVLIVEDVEINREIVETLLEEYGFLTESVPDGHYAVEAVKNHPAWYYDLVLMDIQMPVMNGYDAARAIRAIPRVDIPSLPIIALSANSREEDKRMSLESGMNSHVAKPFDIDPLINTINEHIAERKK